jgi:hypothetical protein
MAIWMRRLRPGFTLGDGRIPLSFGGTEPMHDFEQAFLARATKRGGLTLLPASEALALVEAARANGVPVLGIETFLLTTSTTQPQMDHILELSKGDDKCDTWAEARQFISERGAQDFWFEVAL